MSSLRVLHLSSGNLYGGVEVLLTTLSRERMACAHLEPHFALCFAGKLSGQLEELGTPAVILGTVRTRFPWEILRVRRRLARLLREQSFDVVICHMAWAQAIFGPVVRKAGLPLVFWMHDVAKGKSWLDRWARWCWPDLVICNSQFTALSLEKLYPGPPAHEVVYCPVSEPPMGLPEDLRSPVRAEFDVPADATVIIQVGRMEAYKGHALHLQSLARLADVPGWVCWIVGGAQRDYERAYLDSLRAQAAEAGIDGRVKFLGERRDVSRLLAAADVFCQPNLSGEPFGIVFIEALYAGLPVVATALGGALEIVNESCGRLVPPNDPATLAYTLARLLSETATRAKLGRNGPARAKELSEPQRVLGHLHACLSRVDNL